MWDKERVKAGKYQDKWSLSYDRTSMTPTPLTQQERKDGLGKAFKSYKYFFKMCMGRSEGGEELGHLFKESEN